MPAQTRERVERICEAIVQVTPQVITASEQYPAFYETGKRMLYAWNDGMNSLRCKTACKTFQISGVISVQKLPPWVV